MARPTPETLSHSLAFTLTAAMVGLWLAVPHAASPPAPASHIIEIALAAEPSPPEPSPPAPPPPVPEPPKAARPIVHREPQRSPAPPLMAAVAPTPADLAAGPESPASPMVQLPPPARAPSGTVDAQYATSLRSNIDSRTTAPTSVEYRLLKPHGEVRVNFTLDRSGMVLSSELARSSGSHLLDHHALEIVREGRYPPFPGDAFPGESSHSFLVTLEFHS